MDEEQVVIILVTVIVILLGIISIGACLYAIPLCFIRRFHTPLNLLTLNVCIAAFVCAVYCAIYEIMNAFYPDIFWTSKSCLLNIYLQTAVICQVIYGLCIVSLNRIFVVIYKNKALFRTKKWVLICVIFQWIFAAAIPLPSFASSLEHCFIAGLELNYQIYTLIIVGGIPTISLVVTNMIIFTYARRSTRRIQTANGNNAPAPAVSRRDAHLLKHMIFMFAVFFCGWVSIYIIAAIDWNGNAISGVTLHGLKILPVASLLIDVANLFLYNHELRRYFIPEVRPGLNTRTR